MMVEYKHIGWVVQVRQVIGDADSEWITYNDTDRPNEDDSIVFYDMTWGNWNELADIGDARCVRVFVEDD